MISLLLLLQLTTTSYCLKKHLSDDDLTIASSTISAGDVPLYHAFGPYDQFTSRGIIAFKSGRAASVINNELSTEDMRKLQTLASEDGLYFIKTPSKIGEMFSDTGENTSYVSTFVKACYLYGSNLQDSITLAIDYSGNIIGLNIVSPRSTCLDVPEPNDSFNSTVQVQVQVAGAAPDTQTFVKKLEQEKSDQAAGKGKDNRSFIAKYWMYIVPVVLMLMISSQAEAPAEGGGGGGGE